MLSLTAHLIVMALGLVFVALVVSAASAEKPAAGVIFLTQPGSVV